MGVRGLWTILDPIREHLPIRSLGGKRIAIDLSGWICGDMQMNQRIQTMNKLYIRNMIFRILALLRESILPVAVTDGVAPALKAGAMAGRKQSKLNGCKEAPIFQTKPISLKRSHFSQISAHCCRLLTAMGVPCVASPGEAEAMCAFLNEAGLVDGCVTNDGDSFLYGASVVYRHFSLDSRDASVAAYNAQRVSTDLGICRKSLVLLGLVLGCDYWPSGVAKVGRVSAVTLLPQLEITLAFDRLTGTDLSSDVDKSPVFNSPIWKKIEAALANCPVEEILNEFLQPCSVRGWSLPERNTMVWSRPRVKRMVELCIDCLDWQPSYSLAQFVPILAIWIIRQRTEMLQLDGDVFLEETYPIRILSKRSVNFLPCFEVQWKRLSTDIWSDEILSMSATNNPLIVSLKSFFTDEGYRFSVPASEFKAAFPHMSLAYESLDLKSISAKLDALVIEIQGRKPKVRAVNQKKAARQKVTLDAFIIADRKQKSEEVVESVTKDDYLLNWDSTPPSTPPEHTATQTWARDSIATACVPQPNQFPCDGPIVWDPFSPPPEEDTRLQYISVRLNTAFERRRLTLNSSLLSTPPSTSIDSLMPSGSRQTPLLSSPALDDKDDFSFFKTPIRLTDRLR